MKVLYSLVTLLLFVNVSRCYLTDTSPDYWFYGDLPDLAALQGDQWVMVYCNNNNIYASIYLNNTLQNNYLVFASSTCVDSFPQVERINSTSYIIVFAKGSSPKQVYGRVCDTSGCFSSAFRVDDLTSDNKEPKVTFIEGTTQMFVAWKTEPNAIYGRVMNLNGTAASNTLSLRPDGTISYRLELTNVIVTGGTRKWFMIYDDQNGSNYMMAGYANGTYGGPWYIYSGMQPDIKSNGNLSIAYTDTQNIGIQFDNSSLNQVCCGAGPTTVNYPLSNSKYSPQVSLLSGGKVLVEWTSLVSSSPLLWEQVAQIVYPNGTRFWSDDLRLNYIPATTQGNYGFSYGFVAALVLPSVPDAFAAAWTCYEAGVPAIHYKIFYPYTIGNVTQPTPSVSPSVSPSVNPSATPNPSPSTSPTPSVTSSASLSASPGASYSPTSSPAVSSASPSSVPSSPSSSPTLSISPSSSSSPSDSSSKTKSQAPVIAGVVIGLIGSAGVGVACFAIIRKRRKDKKDDQEPSNLELQPSKMNRQDSATSITSVTPTVDHTSDKGWKIPYQDISLGPQLGRGAFGTVYQCTWRNTECVIKLLNIERENSPSVKAFLREANNVRSLRNHPNICSIMGICTDPVAIVMEYVAGGSLLHCMASKQIDLDARKVIKFAKDIASGMSHLHAENIMHLDLACRNLLVAFGKDNTQQIKITDFGLSRLMDADTYTASEEATFPIRWTAPETLMMRLITRASDVWSFGVTIWEIIERKVPYSELSTSAVADAVNKGKRLARPTQIDIPDSLWELVQSCWHENIQLRPSFDQICATLKQIDIELNPLTDKEKELEYSEVPQAAVSSSEAQVSTGSTGTIYSAPYGNAFHQSTYMTGMNNSGTES